MAADRAEKRWSGIWRTSSGYLLVFAAPAQQRLICKATSKRSCRTAQTVSMARLLGIQQREPHRWQRNPQDSGGLSRNCAPENSLSSQETATPQEPTGAPEWSSKPKVTGSNPVGRASAGPLQERGCRLWIPGASLWGELGWQRKWQHSPVAAPPLRDTGRGPGFLPTCSVCGTRRSFTSGEIGLRFGAK